MQDAGCKMPDARCRMQDAGYKMPDARCRIQDAGYKMPDERCQMKDAGCRMPDTRTEKSFGVFLLGIEFINPEGLCSNPFYFFIGGGAAW